MTSNWLSLDGTLMRAIIAILAMIAIAYLHPLVFRPNHPSDADLPQGTWKPFSKNRSHDTTLMSVLSVPTALFFLYFGYHLIFHQGVDTSTIVTGILLGSILIILLHEGSHVVMYRLLGFDVSAGYDLRRGRFFATPVGQILTRYHMIVGAFAPLGIVPTLLGMVVYFDGFGLLGIAAVFAMVFNIPMSSADILDIWRTITYPSGTKFYYTSVDLAFADQCQSSAVFPKE